MFSSVQLTDLQLVQKNFPAALLHFAELSVVSTFTVVYISGIAPFAMFLLSTPSFGSNQVHLSSKTSRERWEQSKLFFVIWKKSGPSARLLACMTPARSIPNPIHMLVDPTLKGGSLNVKTLVRCGSGAGAFSCLPGNVYVHVCVHAICANRAVYPRIIDVPWGLTVPFNPPKYVNISFSAFPPKLIRRIFSRFFLFHSHFSGNVLRPKVAFSKIFESEDHPLPLLFVVLRVTRIPRGT